MFMERIQVLAITMLFFQVQRKPMKQKPVPRESAVLRANNKRKTTSDVFAKFDKVFESFVECQQAADKSVLEAEAQERGKRRKERGSEGRRIQNFSRNWRRFFTSRTK